MIIGFTACHYGSDYLGYALSSIADTVDVLLVAYASTPSHGHKNTTIVNPDTREKCLESAHAFDNVKNKLQWVDGNWPHEGDQRRLPETLYPDADLICVVDADEIWHPHEFSAIQEYCLKTPARNFKQRLITPWRSFNFCCTDQMMPDRFYRLKQEGISYVPQELGVFWHHGYCRKPDDIKYKISIHGHLNEWRENWFNDVYCKWSPTNNFNDLHPTCKDTWTAQPYDKNLMPTIMRKHPYWNLDIVE